MTGSTTAKAAECALISYNAARAYKRKSRHEARKAIMLVALTIDTDKSKHRKARKVLLRGLDRE